MSQEAANKPIVLVLRKPLPKERFSDILESLSSLKTEYGIENVRKEVEVKQHIFYRQMVDALGSVGDERRGVAAISFGEVPSNL